MLCCMLSCCMLLYNLLHVRLSTNKTLGPTEHVCIYIYIYTLNFKITHRYCVLIDLETSGLICMMTWPYLSTANNKLTN